MPTVHVMTEAEREELHTLIIRKRTAETMLGDVHAAEKVFWRAVHLAHRVPMIAGYSAEVQSGLFGPTEDVAAFLEGITKETLDAS